MLPDWDVASDPIRVRLLGAQAQVPHPNGGAHAVEQLRPLHGVGVLGRKVLSCLAGRGHYTCAGGRRRKKIRLLPPPYGVRPSGAAFTAPLRS